MEVKLLSQCVIGSRIVNQLQNYSKRMCDLIQRNQVINKSTCIALITSFVLINLIFTKTITEKCNQESAKTLQLSKCRKCQKIILPARLQIFSKRKLRFSQDLWQIQFSCNKWVYRSINMAIFPKNLQQKRRKLDLCNSLYST